VNSLFRKSLRPYPGLCYQNIEKVDLLELEFKGKQGS